MGETDVHRQQILDLIETLQAWYAHRQDVYVSGNLLFYYVEGNPYRHVSPDVMVCLDLDKHDREKYLLWEEGKAPDLIVEITSKTTRYEDTGIKKGLYAALGVREYLLFDPQGEYLKPSFQVYRLAGEDYLRVIVPGDSPAYTSESLGLEFRVVEGVLRLFEAGALLPTASETRVLRELAEQRADSAEQRADSAEQRADSAEQRARALEQRLRDLGVDPTDL